MFVQKILLLLSKIDFFDGIGCVGSILNDFLSIFSVADIHESLKNKKDMDKVIYISNLLPLLVYSWMVIVVFIFLHDLELKAVTCVKYLKKLIKKN